MIRMGPTFVPLPGLEEDCQGAGLEVDCQGAQAGLEEDFQGTDLEIDCQEADLVDDLVAAHLTTTTTTMDLWAELLLVVWLETWLVTSLEDRP